MYVLLLAFVYLPGSICFFGYGTSFVYGSLLCLHIYVTTTVSVHIMYYECSSTYMYILCTMISAALL